MRVLFSFVCFNFLLWLVDEFKANEICNMFREGFMSLINYFFKTVGWVLLELICWFFFVYLS